jgi:hypothetical protein
MRLVRYPGGGLRERKGGGKCQSSNKCKQSFHFKIPFNRKIKSFPMDH